MAPAKQHIMSRQEEEQKDRQETASPAAPSRPPNTTAPEPQLQHDQHTQVLQEAASALRSLHDRDNACQQFDEEIPLTFPQRLMELLDDSSNDDVIGWLPHGQGFLIYQKRRFAAEIMPKYFKQSKFTSFTRKLNRWGFLRISRGLETGAYYHPYFKKGNLRLCLQMTSQSLKGPDSAGVASKAAAAAAATNAESARVASGGTETPTTTNMAPPSMLRHQEASAVAPKVILTRQQRPIGPAPGLPNTPAASTPAERLRTETATESLLRLRRLQRHQEQLAIRQRQIREEIQAISATLPDKIAQERRQQRRQFMAAVTASASTSTPHATPATQATPPSGTIAPQVVAPGQDPAHSRTVVDAAIDALKRSNADSYLTLLMVKQQHQRQQQQQQQQAPRVQQVQQAQQTNQVMEGITPTDDGRLKAGPSALHPAQAAAQGGAYRLCPRKRPSGAKRASAA